MQVWEMIDAERLGFADLADSLTPQQFDQQSLCTAWKVRDVVAHVTEGSNLTAGKAFSTLVKYGFRMNTMLQREALKDGAKPTDELRKELRETIGKRQKPPGAKPVDLLVDFVVHQQDVRRPLGLARTIAPETLVAALDRAASLAGPGSGLLPGKKRTAGLNLHATDISWEHGEGDNVSGPGEALLMAVAGRTAALSDLSGPGVQTLRARTGA